MTIGTSGAAPSVERDPDSLEREDDSLFPACLLEVFLSHISPAKSPLFFFPWPLPHSHWLMTYPPPLRALWSDQQPHSSTETSQVSLPTGCLQSFLWLLLCQGPSSESSIHIQRTLWQRCSCYTHTDQLDSCFGLYQYLFCAQSALCGPLPCPTHTHTQRLYIDLNRGIITGGGVGVRKNTSWYIYPTQRGSPMEN